MIEDFPTCYRILELEPGATLEEVKRSYRDLVKVWHPDRFPNDPKLQKKGEEKLKQINLAYDRICKGNFERSRESSPPAATSAQQPGKNAHASSGTGTSNNQSSSPREEPPRSQRSNPSSTAPAEQNGGRRFIQIAAAVAVIFIVKAIFFADGDLSKQTRGYSPHPTTQPPVLLEAFVPANPAQRLKPDGNPGLALSAVPPSARTPILEMVESPSIGVAGGSNTVAPAKTPEQPSAKFNRSIAGYFSVGSTKDEVLAVQGTPSRFTDTTFSYGSSDIIFGNGKVVSWTQYSMNPLRAKLLPTTRVGAIEFFTVGSTKDEVLAVQGTPSKFTDTTFSYGSSDVIFGNGKVVSWTQYSMNPLTAKLLPTNRVGAIEFFTVGSTKDEVLAAQGTPSKFTDTTFSYGSSDVIFGNGKVVSWTQYSMNPLKAKLLPTTRVGAIEYFTVGSTKDEVIAAQGTPSKFTDTTFSYGSSDVIFGNGKVVSWTQYSMNPLKAKLLPTTRVEPQLPVKPEGNLPLSKLGATSSRILYPWKTYVKFTIFGIGELPTDRPPLNQISSWDQNWKNNYGGFDDPNPANRIANRTAGEFRPKAFVPKLNSFYVALPYNDLETNGKQKAEASRVIPWFVRFPPESGKSACKSVWLQIFCNGRSCYAQWEAHGPSVTDDWDFVFGTKPPKTSQSGSAGIGVSPAIRDYLSLKSGDKVHWRFLETTQVPAGPWGKYGHN